jgi:hypothetical protein
MEPGSIWDLESPVLSEIELNSIILSAVVNLESFIPVVEINSTIMNMVSDLSSNITDSVDFFSLVFNEIVNLDSFIHREIDLNSELGDKEIILDSLVN